MLGWLKGLLNFFGGGLREIWNTVLSLVTSVYRSLADDDNRIIAFANTIYVSLWRLGIAYGIFTSQDYPAFVRWVNAMLARIQDQERRDTASLINDINNLSHRSQQDITVVQQGVQSDISALIKWILSVLFNPLKALVSVILAWIGKEGAWMLDLLTHLDKFADLIMAFMWSGWLRLFRKYLKQIVVFSLAHWKSWVPSVMNVIEDIIVSVL